MLPTDLANLFAWYKADALSEAEGAALATWPDSSGGVLRNLSQDTVANQPKVATKRLNGLKVIDFVPTNYMTTAAFLQAETQPHTILLVAKRDVVGATMIFCDGTATTDRVAIYSDSARKWRMFAGSVLSSDVEDDTDWHIFSCMFNTGSSGIIVDQGVEKSGNVGSRTMSTFRVGAHWDANFPLDGQIAEVIIYSDLKTLSEIASLEDYLKAKWDLLKKPSRRTDIRRRIIATMRRF